MAAQRHFATANGVNVKSLSLTPETEKDISGDLCSPSDQAAPRSLPNSPGVSVETTHAAGCDDVALEASADMSDVLSHECSVIGAAHALDSDSGPEFDDNPLLAPTALPFSPAMECRATNGSSNGNDAPLFQAASIDHFEFGGAAYAPSDEFSDTAIENIQKHQLSPPRRAVLFDQISGTSTSAPAPQTPVPNSEFESMMLEETEANFKCVCSRFSLAHSDLTRRKTAADDATAQGPDLD